MSTVQGPKDSFSAHCKLFKLVLSSETHLKKKKSFSESIRSFHSLNEPNDTKKD